MKTAERATLERVGRRLGLARKVNRNLRWQIYELQRELAQSQRDHQDLINRVNQQKDAQNHDKHFRAYDVSRTITALLGVR